MIRQERRRFVRDYQKELDKLNKIATKLYGGHDEDNKMIKAHLSTLTEGLCEDKKLQSYFNLMADLSKRMQYLQREITKLNDNATGV